MPTGYTVEMADAEFLAMLADLQRIFSTQNMATRLTWRLRKRFQAQVQEAYAKEGVPDGEAWPWLSDFRLDERLREGYPEEPILQASGVLRSETEAWKGKLRGNDEGFSYWFPDFYEMTGQMWGLFAGQLVNPLGRTPLATVPRPILGGPQRMVNDTVSAFAEYLDSEGLIVESVDQVA